MYVVITPLTNPVSFLLISHTILLLSLPSYTKQVVLFFFFSCFCLLLDILISLEYQFYDRQEGITLQFNDNTMWSI